MQLLCQGPARAALQTDAFKRSQTVTVTNSWIQTARDNKEEAR